MLFLIIILIVANFALKQMTDKHSIAGIRKVYQLQSLTESEAEADPIQQFAKWWKQVMESNIDEPNAMVLSTCGPEGKPSSRIVLLKGFQEEGFVFFTNYHSRKGKEIAQNPFCSLLFFWKELERQVRIEGTVSEISSQESDDYFFSRPRESRIGAWASPQSEAIENREVLEKSKEAYDHRFAAGDIPRPAHWGGYLLKPACVEFWQGRPGRLHDRLQYVRTSGNKWHLQRLAP